MYPEYIRLQQEIKDVLGDRTTVTEKDLEELQYTEQVCYQTDVEKFDV